MVTKTVKAISQQPASHYNQKTTAYAVVSRQYVITVCICLIRQWLAL